MRLRVALAAAIGALLVLAGCGDDDETSTISAATETATTETTSEQDKGDGGAENEQVLLRAPEAELETVATGLEVPWEMAFLPDGSALLTERPGRVRRISADGELDPEPVAEIPVAAVGEGGLLGLAIDPEFERKLLRLHLPDHRRRQRGRPLPLRGRPDD